MSEKSLETPLEGKGCTDVTLGPRIASQGICPLKTMESLIYFPWFQGMVTLEMLPLDVRLHHRCIPKCCGMGPNMAQYRAVILVP